MIHNFFFLVGMEPGDVRIPFEPRHLLAGVDAGGRFDFLDGKVERPFSVEVLEHFLIANGVQRVQMLVFVHTLGFFQEDLHHQSVYPHVDAVVECHAA